MKRTDTLKQNRSANLQNGEYAVSQSTAAELLNVSPRLVATVKAVEREAPELISKIERGEMTAHEAEKKARQMKRERRLSWSAFLGYRW
jgi:Mn-dependent DtxR family transcriptional regulator